MDKRTIFLVALITIAPIQSYSSSNSTYMPTPVECINNEECPDNFYCAKTTCDAPYGYCKLKPRYCTQDYNPVCGCDGHTYSNACVAHAAGVNINYTGHCQDDTDSTCYGNTTATLDITTGILTIPVITLKGAGLNGLCFSATMKWTGKGFIITNAKAIPCKKPVPLPKETD